MADPDRRTGIDGDQITDGSLTPTELMASNSPSDDDIVAIDNSGPDIQFKYVSPINLNSDLAAVQKHRTTTFLIPLAFTDITLDITDVENNTAVLEADNVNTERILIKETGLHLLTYGGSVNSETADHPYTFRILRNGTTIVPGSVQTIQDDFDELMIGFTVLAILTAGDYITFQAMQTDTPLENTELNNALFHAARLKGSKGNQGDVGSGSSITLQEDDINVPNTPHSTLNFEGNVNVTDDGAGKATVTIPTPVASVFGSEFEEASSEGESSTTSTTFQEKLSMTTANLPLGDYIVTYSFELSQSGSGGEGRVELNNTTEIGFHRVESSVDNAYNMASGFQHLSNISGVQQIDIDFRVFSSSTTLIRRARITIWRVS